VQVHCDEGVANHIGPAPCVGVREDSSEASAGERIGQPLSRERTFPGCRRRDPAGRQHGRTRIASVRTPGVVEEPGMCVRSLHGNREVSRVTDCTCTGPHREGEEP
jgi:hypothetical protein